jgi:hypothetical protein
MTTKAMLSNNLDDIEKPNRPIDKQRLYVRRRATSCKVAGILEQ